MTDESTPNTNLYTLEYLESLKANLKFYRDAYNKSTGVAKRYGRKCILRTGWEEMRVDMMRFLLVQKFSIPDLERKLFLTGTEDLVEDNLWGDQFWGVYDGVGENNLGKILMDIRETIRQKPEFRLAR